MYYYAISPGVIHWGPLIFTLALVPLWFIGIFRSYERKYRRVRSPVNEKTQTASGWDRPVPAAPPMKYVLGYRSRTLNPNPITDPNPNPNPKNNKKEKKNETGMKLNIQLYLKVDFLWTGVGL